MLHLTKDNLGRKNLSALSVWFSGRPCRNLFIRLSPVVHYVYYDASRLSMQNDGFFFRLRGEMELELPHSLYLSADGGYNTRYIMLQGRGSTSYNYTLSLSKYFLKISYESLVAQEVSCQPIIQNIMTGKPIIIVIVLLTDIIRLIST